MENCSLATQPKTGKMFSSLPMLRLLLPMHPSLRLSFRRFSTHFLTALLVLCTAAAPSAANLALQKVDEARSPLEAKEEAREQFEESRMNGQRRFQLSFQYRECRVNGNPARLSHLIVSQMPRCVQGHRLLNDILAPLTC